MRRIYSFFFLLSFLFIPFESTFGKEVKPQVLIYGDNLISFAAALQSARSGVPTLWVVPSATYSTDFFSTFSSFDSNDELVGGVWLNILQEVSLQKGSKDSLIRVDISDLNPVALRSVMDKMVDMQKNLTVVKNISVLKLVNDKKKIDVVLSNKMKVKVLAVVDATTALSLSGFVSRADQAIKNKQESTAKVTSAAPLEALNTSSIRTLLAIGRENKQVYGTSMEEILSNSVDNLFFTSSVDELQHNHSVLYQLNIGQAIGATAAYCAFFKTASENVDVRKVQTELLAFESRLLPFSDISREDPNFNALQRIFLVNILPWNRSGEHLSFDRLEPVSVASVRQVLLQLYSRAQLWYVDNTATDFTTKDMIELLKVISFRGNELDDEIQKSWKKRFRFDNDFDLQHMINRYEFAVLLDAYAAPFSKRINTAGVIQR